MPSVGGRYLMPSVGGEGRMYLMPSVSQEKRESQETRQKQWRKCFV
jgi:hypothetical protein